MEELLGSLIPPRSNMSLLGAGLSTSMPRGDSATECLHEELADASDVDERVLLLPAMNFMRPLMVTPCCQRGAPELLKRGQAGRPRVMGPTGLGCSWPSSTSSFSGDFLVRFLASVQYIFYALHCPNTRAPLLPCPCCPLATLFLHFVSFTLYHTSSFITWCHLC